MRDHPIIFSAPMVRAILCGRKTQTRRVVLDPDRYGCLTGDCPHQCVEECDATMYQLSPYGQCGDRLWVRETWGVASRMTLSVKNVRCEYLQEITDADAIAEGVGSIREFEELWDALSAKRGYAWESNPWVWVITFRQVD